MKTTLSLSSAEPDRPRHKPHGTLRQSPAPTPERLAEAAALFDSLAGDDTEFGRLMARLADSVRRLAGQAAAQGIIPDADLDGTVLHFRPRPRRPKA